MYILQQLAIGTSATTGYLLSVMIPHLHPNICVTEENLTLEIRSDKMIQKFLLYVIMSKELMLSVDAYIK